MTDHSQQCIELLERTLEQATLLSDVERSQVVRRIIQLRRRAEDPRTFIAFIGEKKAGKTALVKALTGVPLPVAVRECTAAICEIQVGLDWHHHATYSSGQIVNFQPIDNTSQRFALIEAQRANSSAAEAAIGALNEADNAIQQAKIAIDLSEQRLTKAEAAVQEAEKEHQDSFGGVPWLWSILSFFIWWSDVFKHRIARIKRTEALVHKAQKELAEAQISLLSKKEQVEAAHKNLPQLWQSAQSAATKSRKQLEQAKDDLEDIKSKNKNRFEKELTDLIDVAKAPAERVTIHTPNANIPFNIVLLDTPGFNTELESHRRRAWEAIEELADICILVSDLRQPMPDTALSMLERIEPFVPFLHVALTKTDLALAEAIEIGDDPEEEIKEAEEVARRRIKKRWERPMNIWTVASIEDEDQQKTRKLFEEFWQILPENARTHKSTLLGAHAIRELMEILTVHLQRLQEEIKDVDKVVSNIAYDLASKLADKDEEIAESSQQILEKTRHACKNRLANLQDEWLNRIMKCESKFQIRKEWDILQKDMIAAYQQSAELTSMDLELGIRQTAGRLWQGSGEVEVDGSDLLTYDEEEVVVDGDDDKTWLWTAGGAAAGAALGVALTGGIAIPLILAAGAGGVAQILLSPLAVVKENLQKKVSLSVEKEEAALLEQISQIEPNIAEKIIDAAEKEIQRELEKREKAARQQKLDEINVVQQLWNNLFEARQNMIRSNQEVVQSEQ